MRLPAAIAAAVAAAIVPASPPSLAFQPPVRLPARTSTARPPTASRGASRSAEIAPPRRIPPSRRRVEGALRMAAEPPGDAASGGTSGAGGTGTASIPNEVFNLVKSIVGAGVLSLPAGEFRSDVCRFTVG